MRVLLLDDSPAYKFKYWFNWTWLLCFLFGLRVFLAPTCSAQQLARWMVGWLVGCWVVGWLVGRVLSRVTLYRTSAVGRSNVRTDSHNSYIQCEHCVLRLATFSSAPFASLTQILSHIENAAPTFLCWAPAGRRRTKTGDFQPITATRPASLQVGVVDGLGGAVSHAEGQTGKRTTRAVWVFCSRKEGTPSSKR